MTYLLVVIMTFIGACGAYFFKKSADKMQGVVTLLRTPTLYLGGALYAASAVMNVVLLRYMDYTVLYPMTSITYIWSLVISNRLLGEKITGKKVLGIGLICAGVVFVAQ